MITSKNKYLMDLTPLLMTFGLIAIAELGDKTQLTVIALSAGYDRVKVFTGAIFGFILVTGLGILVGETLFLYISPSWSDTCAWINNPDRNTCWRKIVQNYTFIENQTGRRSGIYPLWDIVFGWFLNALAGQDVSIYMGCIKGVFGFVLIIERRGGDLNSRCAVHNRFSRPAP